MEEQQNMNQEYCRCTSENRSVVSIGEWIVTLLIMIIPLVNFIMLFVWGFGSNTPKSKSNWAKASLIFMAVGVILTIVLFNIIMAGGMFDGLMD